MRKIRTEHKIGERMSSQRSLPRTYSPDNLYNADETDLCIGVFPDHGFTKRGKDLPGGKKTRITALFCANMSGSVKKNLLIIGTAARPKGFLQPFRPMLR